MTSANKTLINILAAARSGSTMLDLMMGNDSESFSLGEVNAWFRPFRTHHFHIDCNCGYSNCEYWNRVKHYKESEFHRNAFEDLQVNYLVDSSKDLDWVIDNNKWALEHNIEIVNFIIYKPIKEFAHSIWKRDESLDEAMNRFTKYYSRFMETRIPAYSINYRQLIENPEDMLKTLCSITGQNSYADRKKFWEKEHHHLFGSGGIRKQLREGNYGFRVSANYPDNFLEQWDRYKIEIQKNSSFSGIMDYLEKIDVRKQSGNQYTFEDIQKPYWYYYLRMKNKVKAVFPETL